jgi:hypothetical protein
MQSLAKTMTTTSEVSHCIRPSLGPITVSHHKCIKRRAANAIWRLVLGIFFLLLFSEHLLPTLHLLLGWETLCLTRVFDSHDTRLQAGFFEVK